VGGQVELLTFGHGTAGADELASLVRGAAIERVVDVRTVPKSRLHAHVWSDRMAEWLPAQAGAAYEWVKDLGGFRKARPDSPNTALRNDSFRGYADYMETPPFRIALGRLIAELRDRRTAVMCSETLWWRCHRRLIADACVLLHGLTVRHLGHDGRLSPHVPTDGVRVEGDHLRYDVVTA
jgi:uncharacterized protein (DUF488 family)